MIPKIIHYCWLSNDPMPKKIKDYINSWKKNLPDYDFICWNFDKFNKNSSLWVQQAFDNKKYAFAADYIRLYALYNYGGIYLDTDVEVLKPFDDFLNLKTMICFENSEDNRLEVATLGVEKHSQWIKDCLAYYEKRSFIKNDGTFDTQVLPLIVKDMIMKNNYTIQPVYSINEANTFSKELIPVFPYFYFSPKSYSTGKIESNEKTISIHHFAGSWKPWFVRIEDSFWQKFHLFNPHILLRLYNLFKHGSLRQFPH